MSHAAKALSKDAKHYEHEMKHTKSKTKKHHEAIEKKEAIKGAKVIKKMARKAHEY